MLKPDAKETEKAFTNRFMSDDDMKKEYPNIDQRMAVAHKQFKAAQAHEEFEEISGREIFKTGTYYGRKYTEETLDLIAKNTNELIVAGKHRAPSKLGHDDSQTFAKLNGLPAVGWVSRVFRKGASLFADFVDVPKLVADAIQKKLYNSVSSEIYLDEHAKREFGVKGPVLRAVAWLGADVPKVKGMSPLAALMDDAEDEVAIVKLEDEPAGKLMVPANRHPYGALVKVNGGSDLHVVHAIHADGTYSTHGLRDPNKYEQFVPHDSCVLLTEQEAAEAFKISEEHGEPGEAGTNKASGKNDKEVTMTEQEIEALKAKAADSDKKAAEALKFGEEEKKKREALELTQKEGRIAAFCETHKAVLIPALQPKFKTLALAQSAAVKFDDKEVEPLDAFLSLTEEIIKAKAVPTGELPEGKDKGEPSTDAVAKLEETFLNSRKGVEGVDNADLAIRAEKYAEEHKVSYRDALLTLSAKVQKED